MMGASTKILLVSIPANPKLSANCLADCAAAVHPHQHKKTAPFDRTQVFRGRSQD